MPATTMHTHPNRHRLLHNSDCLHNHLHTHVVSTGGNLQRCSAAFICCGGNVPDGKCTSNAQGHGGMASCCWWVPCDAIMNNCLHHNEEEQGIDEGAKGVDKMATFCESRNTKHL
eukprot:1678560-Amphidinium_carterae.1